MAGTIQSNNIIVTSDGKKYKKPSNGMAVAGYLAGSAASAMVQQPISGAASKCFEAGMKKVVSDFGEGGQFAKEVSILRNTVEDAFLKSGLDKKGIKILDATEANANKITRMMYKGLPKWVRYLLIKNQKISFPAKKQIQMQVQDAIKGKNAFYADAAKKIVFSKDKNPILAFHEMGHALNFNTKGLGKILSTVRNPMLKAAGLISLVALCKRKKQEGEETKGIFDKVTTFIKNNCGKLAFLCAVPMLMEEGLATLKGLKLAKSAGLSKKLLKQVKLANLNGFISYVGLAVAMGVGTAVASKVRDMVAKPKEIV